MSANDIIKYLDLNFWVKIVIEKPQVLYVLNFTSIETSKIEDIPLSSYWTSYSES